MRVSKVMKDYIEEQVNAKFQPKIDELQAQIDKEREEFEDVVKDIAKKANAEAFKVLEESPLELSFPSDMVQPHFYGIYHPLRDETCALRDRAEETTKSIIVELELGGNKQTLERLLQEIEV